jgi:transposase
MRTPTKFVKPLTQAQQQRLQEIQKTAPAHRTRMRAHAVLLSARGYTLDQIADIYQQDRDRVSLWLDWWSNDAYDGLADDPKSGRPALLADETAQKKPVKSSLRRRAP